MKGSSCPRLISEGIFQARFSLQNCQHCLLQMVPCAGFWLVNATLQVKRNKLCVFTFRVITPNWTLHLWHSSASTQSGAWKSITHTHTIVIIQIIPTLLPVFYSTIAEWPHPLCSKHGIALFKLWEHMTWWSAGEWNQTCCFALGFKSLI